jgi:hypothetical protein
MVRRLHFAVGALLGLAAATCTQSTQPIAVAGTYRLNTVDGHAPPARVSATVNADRYLVDGSLELSADGKFTMLLSTMLDTRTGGPLVDSVVAVYWGSYHADGNAVALYWLDSTQQQRTFAGTASGAAVTVTVADGQVFAAWAALTFART